MFLGFIDTCRGTNADIAVSVVEKQQEVVRENVNRTISFAPAKGRRAPPINIVTTEKGLDE